MCDMVLNRPVGDVISGDMVLNRPLCDVISGNMVLNRPVCDVISCEMVLNGPVCDMRPHIERTSGVQRTSVQHETPCEREARGGGGVIKQ